MIPDYTVDIKYIFIVLIHNTYTLDSLITHYAWWIFENYSFVMKTVIILSDWHRDLTTKERYNVHYCISVSASPARHSPCCVGHVCFFLFLPQLCDYCRQENQIVSLCFLCWCYCCCNVMIKRFPPMRIWRGVTWSTSPTLLMWIFWCNGRYFFQLVINKFVNVFLTSLNDDGMMMMIFYVFCVCTIFNLITSLRC